VPKNQLKRKKHPRTKRKIMKMFKAMIIKFRLIKYHKLSRVIKIITFVNFTQQKLNLFNVSRKMHKAFNNLKKKKKKKNKQQNY